MPHHVTPSYCEHISRPKYTVVQTHTQLIYSQMLHGHAMDDKGADDDGDHNWLGCMAEGNQMLRVCARYRIEADG